MKLPEPVAWMTPLGNVFAGRQLTAEAKKELFPLVTEAQLRRALAQQEVVMRMALEALKRMERYGNTFLYRRDEQNPHEQTCEAIKVLEEQLK